MVLLGPRGVPALLWRCGNSKTIKIEKKATAAGICTWSPNVVRVLSSLTSSFGQSKVLYEG